MNKGSKVRIEWDVTHIGFSGAAPVEVFKGISNLKNAQRIVAERDCTAMKKATYFDEQGKETNLLK